MARWIARQPAGRLHLRHLRREKRSGYKAGALTEGLAASEADFFAIFDADFRPRPDFLEKLMPYFADPGVGVVQARWEYVNRHASLLTWMQAAVLDIHFVLEQTARSHSGLFFNFNGTAGIWRRQALVDGGGWSADTVTEDLDLSYRAQRAGWKFIYTPDYCAESELPESLTAFKSQQWRWTKGGAQVARRQLGMLLRSRLSLWVKAEILGHLTIGAVYPLTVAWYVTGLPFLYFAHLRPESLFVMLMSVAAVATALLIPALTFGIAQLIRPAATSRSLLGTLVRMPVLILFFLAMSFMYAAAYFEGLTARAAGEFVRTPKGRGSVRKAGLLKSLSSRRQLTTVALLEVAAGLTCGAAALGFALSGQPVGAALAAAMSATMLSFGAWSVTDTLRA